MRLAAILIVLSSALLAACGGSSGGGSGPTPAVAPNVYGSLANQQLGFAVRNQAPVSTAVMPVVGAATYRGVASFSNVSTNQALGNPDVVGNFEVNANFGAQSISASMSGLVDRTNAPLTGGMVVSSGPINGNTFQGTLSGSVTNSAGLTSTTGGIAGGFFGSNAEVVLGGIGTSGGALPTYGVFTGDR